MKSVIHEIIDSEPKRGCPLPEPVMLMNAQRSSTVNEAAFIMRKAWLIDIFIDDWAMDSIDSDSCICLRLYLFDSHTRAISHTY